MGRLFWKFLIIFWLAQVVTSVGVGLAVWVEQPAPAPATNFFLTPPVLPILAGSVVSLLFAPLLAWYFAKPIRNLSAAFESVAAGRLETRVGASMGRRNDEFADLGKDFDRMADRLESLLGAQRRLLHDVSHELRSPLARLQALADLMRQQPERCVEFVERIERDTARMDTLVGELLTLARLDAGMTGKLDEEVDLRELVGDIAEDARFEADAKRCTIGVDLSDALVARGSYELLYRAVENIVRNAVRHSPEAGIVTISARAVDERLRIVVADRGPGVVDTDLAAIFNTFFRSDQDRSAAGYGLGLAITRRVADAHGGRVSAANRAEGGLLVTLELPFAI